MPELVALTGATGFIGCSLLKAFTNSATKVRALSRQAKNDGDLSEWIVGDLNSMQALEKLVDGADTIIHCAGTVRGKSEEDFLSTNTRGTANLLKACKGHSQGRRFLLISSLAARQPELSWYAASKNRAEAVLKSESTDMACTIFRPTAVYGPGDREIRPLLRLMKLGLLPAPNTNSRFSLLHINDLVNAIIQWVSSPNPLDGVYELDDGNANGYNWEILIEIVNQIWGKSVLRIPIPLPLLHALAALNLEISRIIGYSPMLTPGKVREIMHPDWTCDITALSRDLGWQPGIKLADAMQQPSLLQL